MSRVYALLSWFDESPTWLAQCVASIARVADHLVAVDGRYLHYPADDVCSPAEQAACILQTCEAAGLPVTLHRPDRPFPTEIAKRNLTLQLARVAGGTPDDWVIVVDADSYVTHVDDSYRLLLDELDTPVANYGLMDGLDLQANGGLAAFAANTPGMLDRWVTQSRSLYRLLPDLEYTGAHWVVRGTWKGEMTYLWGRTDLHQPQANPADLTWQVVLTHRNRLRPAARQQAAKRYYEIRDSLGLERLTTKLIEQVDGTLAPVRA